ncbi:MAG: DUF4870 domain-containing protein [Phycisphaerales bacterium]|nr:MAG: DUF4870 domain-containing protein [Phycisphaerales bacterium]
MNPPGTPYTDPATPPPLPSTEAWERTYATFQHLTLLLVFAVIPVVPALAMWLIKREQSHYIDDHGKETVNFQLSLLIYTAAGWILTAVTCGIAFPISILITIACYALGIVGMIMGAVAANNGRYFRYPMTLRVVS